MNGVPVVLCVPNSAATTRFVHVHFITLLGSSSRLIPSSQVVPNCRTLIRPIV